MVPGFVRPPACLFEPRCAFAFEACRQIAPLPAGPDLGRALCHTPLVRGVPSRSTQAAPAAAAP
jgi:dipeptide transport system ATP-binding protein